MLENGFKYQEKKIEKKLNLEEELQNQFAKTMGLQSFSQYDLMHPVKNKEGQALAKKLEGLTLLKNRVKAQGSVVAADMLTSEMESEYKKQYGLSKKELERMLGEMQQGQVEDFELGKNEYARFETKTRSSLIKSDNVSQSEVYKELGRVLYQRRQEQKLSSFQLVSLEEETTRSFKEQYRLSKKELNKISLDIQTRAVRVEEYGNMPTIEEESKQLRQEAEQKVRQEEARLNEIDREVEKIEKTRVASRTFSESELRENDEKRKARRQYLETGVTKAGKPAEWILGKYAQVAERILVESGDSLDIQVVIRQVEEMQKNLLKNRNIINEKMAEKLQGYKEDGLPAFLCKQVGEEMSSTLEETYSKQFLKASEENQLYIDTDGQQKTLDGILEGMVQKRKEQLKQWAERGKRIQREIGHNRIDLSLSNHKEIKDLYVIPKEDFDAKMKGLTKQARLNLKRVDMVLEEKLSVVNRENISARLLKKYGENLVYDTPSGIYDLVKNYLDQLPEEAKKFEENAKSAIKNIIENSVAYSYMPQAAWNKLIVKNIKVGDSKESIEKKLKELADNTLINMADFVEWFRETELPMSVWQQLKEYRNEIADVNNEDFRQKLRDKLIKELLHPYEKQVDGKVVDYDFSGETLVGVNAFNVSIVYQEGQEDDDDDINELSIEERFSNVARLKGPELLEHPEFKSAFEGHHDLVLHLLNRVLEEKALPLECLKKVSCVNDLENLSYAQMQMVTSMLRQNLRNRNLYVEVPAFADKQEMLMDALNQSLKEEEMDEVSCMEEFEILPLKEEKKQKIYDLMYQKLGTNNFDAIEIPMKKQPIRMLNYWATTMGGYISKSREIVLLDMLKGKLNSFTLSELKEHMDGVIEEQNDKPQIRKLRTRFILSVKENMFRTDADMVELPKDSYAVRNRDKLEDAHRAWQILKEAGKEREALKCCNDYAKYEYSSEHYKGWSGNPAEPLKELLRNLNTKEGEELAKKLRRGEKHNFMNEFLLCDYTALCLRKEINPSIADIMTKSRETDQEGEEALHGVGSSITSNVKKILETLDTLELSTEKYEDYRKKLMPLAIGLYKGEKENKEVQKKRVGVEFVQNLCEEIKKHRKFEAGQGYPNEEEAKENTMLENQVKRYRKLQTYENGILAPILPKLIQDDDFWILMATKKEDAFFEEIDKLISGVRLPLEILERRFVSLGTNFYGEICDRFANEIVLGDKRSKVEWIKVFDDFFKEYSQRKLGDFSIADLTAKLQKEDANNPVIPYVTEILLSHEKGLDLAADPVELQKTLDSFKTPIQSNKKVLEIEIGNYLTEHAKEFQKKEDTLEESENRKEAFRRGCYMYMQTKIIHGEPEVFKANLKKWMEDYIKMYSDMLKETEDAEKGMTTREKKLQDIHTHLDAGIQADAKDFARFAELRTNLRKAGSPLLAALDVKQRVGKKQVAEAENKLNKAEAFKNMLPAVKNCLLERMLSKVDGETLQKEAQWLQEVYLQAEEYMKKIPDKLKELIPSMDKMLSEILLYAYILNIREKKVGNNAKSNQKDIKVNEELIQYSYEQLLSRHQSMSELLDSKYTWAVEYQPVFLKTAEDPNAVLGVEENPVLAPQRHLVMESMAAGLYTLEEAEFKELIERQKKFFAAAEVADKIFSGLVTKHVEEKYQMVARHALIDYFRTDLMNGLENLDTMKMQQQAEMMLQDEEYRKYLLTGILMEEENSETTSKSKKIVSFRKPLKTEERTMHTVANRETMENYLYRDKQFGYGASQYGRQYQQLNYFQKQIFALSVLQWDEGEMLPSMQFVTSKELAESRYITVTGQLEKYASGCELSEITFKIPYDRVIDRLCDSNGNINNNVFADAMARTKQYIQKRQSNLPKNYQLLNDTAHTTKVANLLLERERKNSLLSKSKESKEIETKVSVSDTEELKKWIQGQLQEDKDKLKKENIEEISGKLNQLNDYQFKVLTLALNDRTMLDYTTCMVDNKPIAEYVNQEKRELFKEYNTQSGVYRDDLTKAVQTLQSYQLRDDVELYYDHLRTQDFAKGALERDTKVDWELLKRAMDFAQEISSTKM